MLTGRTLKTKTKPSYHLAQSRHFINILSVRLTANYHSVKGTATERSSHVIWDTISCFFFIPQMTM